MRAVSLLGGGSAQFLYFVAHRRKSAVASWFSISRYFQSEKSSPLVSTSRLKA